MGYIRSLGPVVLDHRFRRIKDALLQAADALYRKEGHQCRPRWTSTLILARRALAVVGALVLAAQGAPAQHRPTVVIQAIADSLINGYVNEQTAHTLADSLQARLRSGAYDGLSGHELAESVTVMFRRITRDGHLGVRFEGGPVARVPAPAGPPSDEAKNAGAGYGFAQVRVLPDGIGYIDLRGFSDDPEALQWADSMMASLANVRALIFDVGHNRGGGPEMIRLLSTYLFDHPVHLVSSFMRGMDAPRERWTLDSVRGPRLATIRVYVLTSRRTISAGESFVFGLRATKRALIIGEPTAGGGHFGAFVALPGEFSMFLPRGRTFDPRTNEGWEATGIQPDIAVSYEQALATTVQRIRRGADR